jgi:excinuclease ABC subunit B
MVKSIHINNYLKTIKVSSFNLKSSFNPTGDQPKAIEKLTKNINKGVKYQTLLGITGSGKTFTLSHVIQNTQKPVLILSPNKTLAAQLFSEFKKSFPQNQTKFFISFYDYYQPEAYLPSSDTYISKDSKINKYIEELRHDTITSLLKHNDVITVASVSAIYDVGSPENFNKASFTININDKFTRTEIAKRLVTIHYTLKNLNFSDSGFFRYRENIIEIFLPNGLEIIEIELEKNKVKSINKKYNNLENQSKDFLNIKNKTSFEKQTLQTFTFFPTKLFVTDKEKLDLSILNIKKELKESLSKLKKQKKNTEYFRLKTRINRDIEMLQSTGYCEGIENYSRHLSFKQPGDPPFTLIDYYHFKFGNDFLLFIDESHISIPQIQGMYNGNYVRKSTLVNYGFRLPSAIDNRPLKFSEFEKLIPQTIFVSATPREYETKKSQQHIVEQLIRPTGILDPKVIIKPCTNQIPDLIKQIEKQIKDKNKTLVLTLTKASAEDLSTFLQNKGIKTKYLHSDIKPLERPKILNDLRSGKIDVLIGINLLREGLDLPEVSLIAILDADKEGFLRNKTSLLQSIGRVARNTEGTAILYADTITQSIQQTLDETNRRREYQRQYNKDNKITAKTIKKSIEDTFSNDDENYTKKHSKEMLVYLETQLQKSIENWDFEQSAKIRDQIKEIKKTKPNK